MSAPVLDAHITRHVVDARFTVEAGTVVTVLFGPSGSGKTTVLRCLSGLDPLDSGEVVFGGQRWNDGPRVAVPPRDRHVGFLFQDHALFPHLGIRGNVAYGLSRMPRRQRDAAVDAALVAARADHLADRAVAQLSGGEAQRVALARALAPRPSLLLLDEPLSSLDAATRITLRTDLRRILTEQAIPTILVTHDRTEALSLGDAVVLMVDGRVRQVGSPADVFDRPTDPSVAGVVGVETAHPARVADVGHGVARIDIGTQRVVASLGSTESLAVGDPVVACIRAEDVAIQLLHTDTVSSQRNQLDATIRAVTPEGPLVRIDLDAGFPLAAYITRPALEDLDLEAGRRVVAVFKGQAVHLVRR